MAQAARQYYGYTRYAASAVQTDAPERASRPDVRVIPGKRASNPALQSISPEYAFAFKLALVVIITIAVLCSVRVWLSASTVALLENVNAVESTLASAQAKTSELEIQHSILSSSTRIEEEAAKIGMVAPADVKYLKIVVPGKVVMNPDGSISLAGTLQNVEDYSALMTG